MENVKLIILIKLVPQEQVSCSVHTCYIENELIRFQKTNAPEITEIYVAQTLQKYKHVHIKSFKSYTRIEKFTVDIS